MEFRTVGTDVEEVAKAAYTHFHQKGYKQKIEPFEFDFPSTPTIVCTRGRSKLIVEVATAVNQSLIESWISYLRTRDGETGLVILTRRSDVSIDDIAHLKRCKIGLYCYENGKVEELLDPQDLSVNVPLPSLQELKLPFKRALQPCFEKIDQGNWLDGFRDSCQVLERIALENLKDGIKRNRLKFVSKSGKATSYTLTQINKMPQGALARVYSEIDAPTQIDLALGRALGRVNRDRVKAVHKTHSAKSSPALRRKVGQHLWTIVSTFRHL